MKIVWLTPYDVSLLKERLTLVRHKTGHSCSWIVNLSNALAADKSIELHIITGSPLIPYSQDAKFNNIYFHVIKNGIPFINRGYPWYAPLNVLTKYYLERKKIIECIKKIKPDIVHSHGTEGPFALAGIMSGYPCVISMQGIVNEISKTSPSLLYRLLRKYEVQAVQGGRHFFCRTDFDSGFIKSVNKKARIYNVAEAMNPVFFGNTWELLDSFKLLFVGSVIERKGVEDLLAAVALVKEKIDAIYLYLIGSGRPDYIHFLKNMCTKLNIDKNVELAGHKTPGEIAEYHRGCQILVLPTKIDNSPNSVAEAMVSGMPVIASNVGGIPSLIKHDENGLLVEPNNAIKLAAAITYLLKNPQKRKLLGDNAKVIARSRHLPEKVAQATLSVYRKIVNIQDKV
jgi:glycosyltransferase involved in cell wall biosynthesis